MAVAASLRGLHGRGLQAGSAIDSDLHSGLDKPTPQQHFKMNQDDRQHDNNSHEKPTMRGSQDHRKTTQTTHSTNTHTHASALLQNMLCTQVTATNYM